MAKFKTNIISLNYFDEFGDGDHAFMAEMLEIFIEDSALFLVDIRSKIEQGNMEGMQRLAHKFKSSLKLLEIDKDQQLLDLLEKKPDSLNDSDFLIRFEKLLALVEMARVEAKAVLEQIKNEA